MKQKKRTKSKHRSDFVTIVIEDIKVGHKNINCPEYEKCLDKHSLKNSDYWICNNCKHENAFIDESTILEKYKLFVDYIERVNAVT